MKIKVFALSLVVLACISGVVAAEETKPVEGWQTLYNGVPVSAEAAKYPAQVADAYRTPGTLVPVEKSIGGSERSWLSARIITYVTRGVVYDSSYQRIDTVRMDNRVLGEKKANFFILTMAFAAALMAFANLAAYLSEDRNRSLVMAIAASAGTASCFAVIHAALAVAVGAVVCASIAAAFAISSAVFAKSERSFTVGSVGFCISVIAAACAWLLSWP